MTEKLLVCCDLDGTLMDEQLTILPETKAALRALIADGHIVYLVTGRMFYSGQVLAEEIAPGMQVVGSNGGIIQLGDHVLKNSMAPAMVAALTELSYAMALSLFLFGSQKVFYTATVPEYLHGDAANRVHSPNPDDYVQLSRDETENIDEVINGIIVDNNEKPVNLTALRDQLTAMFGDQLLLSSSQPRNIELIPAGADKGHAVRTLQRYYGIDAAHTIAFGDGENDISMLAAAGVGVAVGNAATVVKEAARFVTDDYRDAGVANFINHYVFKGVER